MINTSSLGSNFFLSLLAGQAVLTHGIRYTPLACNVGIADDVDAPLDSCTPFSTLVDTTLSADPNARVTVPCGTCAIVDYTDGSTVSFPGGLDVVGRLHFPTTTNVLFETPMIYVQGLFDLPAPLETPNRLTVKLVGTQSYWFTPYDGSTSAQSVGKKPFVVAGGGKIHVRAVPEHCPAWTHLVEKENDNRIVVNSEFASCVEVGDQILVTSSEFMFVCCAFYTGLVLLMHDRMTTTRIIRESLWALFSLYAYDGISHFSLCQKIPSKPFSI